MISPTYPHNMVNINPLAAEICWRVWGTPAHFNGFRILGALLHGTGVAGVSQSCGVEQRALPTFGRAAITLDISPHSSSCLVACCRGLSYTWLILSCLFPFYGRPT